MNNKFKLSALALALIAAQSAQAQLEEVIVTAQKREQRVMEVPVAVTVTTGEQIVRDQMTSLTDLQRSSPSLEVSQTFGGETTGGARLRGIGTQAFNDTATASVAIVYDDLPSGNTSFAQIYDLAQVEVLRGPQGTLFGQTASAGVINITTADPNPEEFDASIGFDYANKGTAGSEWGQKIFRGMMNLPTSDTSAFRLALFKKVDSGIQKNVVLDEDNEEDTSSIRAKFLTYPSEDLRVELAAEYDNTDTTGRLFFTIAKPPTNQAAIDLYEDAPCGVTIDERAEEYCSWQMDDMKRTVKSVSANVQWELDNHTLTFLTTYRDRVEDTYIEDYTRNVNQAFASDRWRAEGSEMLSGELRLTSNLDGPLNYITGLYYYNENSELYPLKSPQPQIDGDYSDPVGFALCTNTGFCVFPPAITTSDSEIKSTAVYGDVTYEASDDLTVFGGLRYTRHNVHASTGRNGPPTANSFGEDKDDLSGRLGFQYAVNDDSMVYGSVAHGFKGQFVEVPAVGDAKLLPAETSIAYELGYKSSLTDSLDLEANIFYTDISNYQGLYSFFIPGGALISNSVTFDVKTKGFEATLRGVAGENFDYTLAYMYADAPYPDGYVGDQGGDIGGEQLVGTAKSKFTFSGEYFDSVNSNMEWFVNFNGYWKGDVRYEAVANDAFIFGAHMNIGGAIGLRSLDGSWRVSLFGRNLTKEREPVAYLASSTEWNGPPAALDGGVRAWPAAGVTVRQVGVTFDYNF